MDTKQLANANRLEDKQTDCLLVEKLIKPAPRNKLPDMSKLAPADRQEREAFLRSVREIKYDTANAWTSPARKLMRELGIKIMTTKKPKDTMPSFYRRLRDTKQTCIYNHRTERLIPVDSMSDALSFLSYYPEYTSIWSNEEIDGQPLGKVYPEATSVTKAGPGSMTTTQQRYGTIDGAYTLPVSDGIKLPEIGQNAVLRDGIWTTPKRGDPVWMVKPSCVVKENVPQWEVTKTSNWETTTERRARSLVRVSCSQYNVTTSYLQEFHLGD